MTKKLARKFVNVYDTGNMTMFCTGIYDDFDKALGATMWDIFDFKDNYRDEGDFFEIGDLEEIGDGDGGVYITVTFRSSAWEENCVHHYYILFQDEEEEDNTNV